MEIEIVSILVVKMLFGSICQGAVCVIDEKFQLELIIKVIILIAMF